MRYSEQRRACKLARAETASRFDYKLPSMRETVAEEQRRDEALTGLERSPALFLIMAMLKAADPLTRTKVCAYSGDAVVRWPECRDTWLAHQVAMAMAGYVEESR